MTDDTLIVEVASVSQKEIEKKSQRPVESFLYSFQGITPVVPISFLLFCALIIVVFRFRKILFLYKLSLGLKNLTNSSKILQIL